MTGPACLPACLCLWVGCVRSCFKGDPEDVAGIRETVRAAAQRLGRPAPKAL